MKRLDDFYELDEIEEYLNFFEIEYEQSLIDVKRFHILKEYGDLVKKGLNSFKYDENQLFDYLKFSLLKVYANYKNGHNPSAAEVWNMFKDGKGTGCLSCHPQIGNSCDC